MNDLSFTERELVALGAALGSNCVPCVEHHISEARKAGLTDPQISEAIQLADKIRKVPAAKVLNTAFEMLGGAPASTAEGNAALCGQAPSVSTANGACCT
jgi:4-carboxymuconolactone decarboxylase